MTGSKTMSLRGFKIVGSIIFFCNQKKFFHSQKAFSLSRNFSTVMELFRNHGTFLQSWNFSTIMELFHSHRTFPVMELFHNHGIFLQSWNFFTIKKLFHNHGAFPQSWNFYTVMELFHSHETFPQSWNFLTAIELFHSHETFPQSWNFSCKRRLKDFKAGKCKNLVIKHWSIKNTWYIFLYYRYDWCILNWHKWKSNNAWLTYTIRLLLLLKYCLNSEIY